TCATSTRPAPKIARSARGRCRLPNWPGAISRSCVCSGPTPTKSRAPTGLGERRVFNRRTAQGPSSGTKRRAFANMVALCRLSALMRRGAVRAIRSRVSLLSAGPGAGLRVKGENRSEADKGKQDQAEIGDVNRAHDAPPSIEMRNFARRPLAGLDPAQDRRRSRSVGRIAGALQVLKLGEHRIDVGRLLFLLGRVHGGARLLR